MVNLNTVDRSTAKSLANGWLAISSLPKLPLLFLYAYFLMDRLPCVGKK